MKTLTFIGGSGFIGKSFIEGFNKGLLKNLKIKKLNIICRKPHFLRKIKKLSLKNIKLIKGDIQKIKSLPSCEIVIYSAETAKIKNYKDKKKITKIHKGSIDNFCKIIKNRKKTKVLYISSGAVYNYLNKNIYKFSNSKYKNIYSELKIYSENQIKKLKKLGIKTSIARCFSFVGPWLPRREHYAIGNFINDGLNKKFINVKENNAAKRSYMYSDDLVYWLAKIAINSKIKCPIYNVGSDQSISIKQLAVLIGKIFNKQIKSNQSKIEKIDRYVPNINKAKRELNLRINYNLMKSIILTINNLNEKAN